MPTFWCLPRFDADFEALTPEQKDAFRRKVKQFVGDLANGALRGGLRVKGVQGWPGVFEMTWAPNGRATFEYGDEVRDGEPHIVWRRVGDHGILNKP